MIDREKVIKGLECCSSMVECGEKCPYWHDKRGCRENLEADALALLKAQEPIKPKPGLWDRDIQLFNCGACDGEIGAGGIAKYCFHCGRAVKWE